MAAPNQYPLGSTVRIYQTFRVRNDNQSAGELTNPTTVIFSHEDPNGVEVDQTYPTNIVRPTTGIYYLDFVCNVPGVWRYRMNGDGSVTEGQFVIMGSVFS